VWTDEQQRAFEETGILHLRAAFTRDQAAKMADSVWRFVERKTDTRRDDTTTWNGRPQVSFKSLKRNSVFAPAYDNVAVHDALDGVFAKTGWAAPNPGGQILMTFPAPEPWTLPHELWHMDCGFERPTWPTFAVKLFACMADIEPEGGATLAIAGSHRLVDRYTPTLEPTQRGGGKDKWNRFMRQDPWLAALRTPGDEPDRTQRMLGETHDADGIPVRVVEMTGEAGDVYLTHLHVFHCAAPNANSQPRMMLGKAIMAQRSDAPARRTAVTSPGR
jgi:ectoine hydroxylase-related dioxygenase (phytanoyl-CoA dioxygenase family)